MARYFESVVAIDVERRWLMSASARRGDVASRTSDDLWAEPKT